jgi:antitoxin PrlF
VKCALHCTESRRTTMTIATLSSKGQITLPAAARRALGLSAGDRVAIESRANEIVIRPTRPFLSLSGFLGPAVPRAKERAAMAKAARRGRG